MIEIANLIKLSMITDDWIFFEIFEIPQVIRVYLSYIVFKKIFWIIL